MKIAVRASPAQQQEWLTRHGIQPAVQFAADAAALLQCKADAYIDLQFDAAHPLLLPDTAPVLVNSVVETCAQLPPNYMRLNAWPGFLGAPVAEVAAGKHQQAQAAQLMENLSWPCELVADIPGMVTARIVAMMINEAYFAWAEGVSTPEQIDTAMKLGTNYPHGPFEWAALIGPTEIHRLLTQLSLTDKLYQPAPALTEAATAHNN